MGNSTEVRAKAELKVSFHHVAPPKKKGEKTRGSGVKRSGKVVRTFQIDPIDSDVLRERIKAVEHILKNGEEKRLSKTEKVKIVKKITDGIKDKFETSQNELINKQAKVIQDINTQHQAEITDLKKEIDKLQQAASQQAKQNKPAPKPTTKQEAPKKK